jgi:hypothetical protein
LILWFAFRLLSGKGNIVNLLKNHYSTGDFRNSWIFPRLDVLDLLPSHGRARLKVRLAIYHVRKESFTEKPLKGIGRYFWGYAIYFNIFPFRGRPIRGRGNHISGILSAPRTNS